MNLLGWQFFLFIHPLVFLFFSFSFFPFPALWLLSFFRGSCYVNHASYYLVVAFVLCYLFLFGLNVNLCIELKYYLHSFHFFPYKQERLAFKMPMSWFCPRVNFWLKAKTINLYFSTLLRTLYNYHAFLHFLN